MRMLGIYFSESDLQLASGAQPTSNEFFLQYILDPWHSSIPSDTRAAFICCPLQKEPCTIIHVFYSFLLQVASLLPRLHEVIGRTGTLVKPPKSVLQSIWHLKSWLVVAPHDMVGLLLHALPIITTVNRKFALNCGHKDNVSECQQSGEMRSAM
jgi:hypothetical protein